MVENRPGAASNIAAELIVKANPDGYMLLLSQTADLINATLYDNLNFVFVRDTAPVARSRANPASWWCTRRFP